METLLTDLRFAFRTLAEEPLDHDGPRFSRSRSASARTRRSSPSSTPSFSGAFRWRIRIGSRSSSRPMRRPKARRCSTSRASPDPTTRASATRATRSRLSRASSSRERACSAPGGEPEQVVGNLVTAATSRSSGRAAAGRMFLPEEDETPGSHPVVVLSHDFWSRRFGADPSIVGSPITLNAQPFTVIGIAPEGFRGASCWKHELLRAVDDVPDVPVRVRSRSGSSTAAPA